MDQAGYSAGGEQYVMDPWQGILVRTDMNSVLEKICKALDEELGFAFDEKLGKDAEWKEVELMKLMREVIAQASSRFTIGKPLCMLYLLPPLPRSLYMSTFLGCSILLCESTNQHDRPRRGIPQSKHQIHFQFLRHRRFHRHATQSTPSHPWIHNLSFSTSYYTHAPS